jgi:recombination protein RecA
MKANQDKGVEVQFTSEIDDPNSSTRKTKKIKEPTISESEIQELAIQNTLRKIEKQFGTGAAFIMGNKCNDQVAVTPSGSISLDIALGVYGYPKGRIVEIYGSEGSGKTTMALKAIAECQKEGGRVVFIDAEHALDIHYARKLGCDVENFILCQPNDGEQALEIVETFLRSECIDLIVIDSVAALTPRAEIDAPMSANHVGLQARMMSQALRKLTAVINTRKATVIFINQLRMKISTGFTLGNPATTPGGNALKFFSSTRIEVRKGETLKIGDKIVGHVIKMKIIKNKVAPPFRNAEYHLFYYDLKNKATEIVHMATELEIVEKRGAWLFYGDYKFHGKVEMLNQIGENPALQADLLKKIRDKCVDEPLSIE